MMALVVLIVYFGAKPSLVFVSLIGLLSLDEILIQFFEKSRKHFSYLLSLLSFIGVFYFFNFIEPSQHFFKIFTNAAILFDILLLYFLFSKRVDKEFVIFVKDKIPILAVLVMLLPLLSFSEVFHMNKWRALLFGALFSVFVVDTAAWFFGKNFGKHKLWPSVSPKKTIEGTVGGVLTSTFVMSVYWWYFFENMTFQKIAIFFFLGCMAQVGDLTQSKVKRFFEIKDSSSLIPGHGGVYDRVDAFIFVAPLYVAFLGYLIN